MIEVTDRRRRVSRSQLLDDVKKTRRYRKLKALHRTLCRIHFRRVNGPVLCQ